MFSNTINVTGIASADGIDKKETYYLTRLINVFNNNVAKNHMRYKYYDDKCKAKNIGISVPEKFNKWLNTAIGWPAKAVDKLADRSIYDGFVVPGDTGNEELDKIMEYNDFKLSYEMALSDELIHGVGFWTVTRGDENMPIIRYYNAQSAAAIWDYDKRRIMAGFVIVDYTYDVSGQIKPSYVVYHDSERATSIRRSENANWVVTSRDYHKMGRPLMESMAFRPTHVKPFGRSRISEAVMAISDEMRREILRCAITSELYSAPMRAILGANDENFEVDKKKLYMERIWMFERNEDGEIPDIKEFKQASMQPHIDCMRNLASRMAAESDLPVNSLGIIHDQPSSAEALRASMEELCKTAENLNHCNSRSLRNIAKLSLAVKHNISYNELSDDEKSLSVVFKDPFAPSLAQSTDAAIKIASVAPYFPELDEFWALVGFTDEQRQRIKANIPKAQANMFVRNNIQPIEQVERNEQIKEDQVIREDNEGSNN